MSDPNRIPAAKIIVLAVVVALLVGVFGYVLYVLNPRGEAPAVAGYKPWSKAVVDSAALIPVQDGGRVKPLSTQASYLMLSMYGARSMKIKSDEGVVKLDPTRWMLDLLFRPQVAVKLPSFRIDNSDVLEAVNLTVRGKRDRYSYEELEPGIGQLMERAQTYEQQEQQKKGSLDPVQKQTLALARNLRLYEAMLGYLSFARNGVVMNPLPGGGADAPSQRVPVSVVMSTAPMIRKVLDDAKAAGQAPPEHVTNLLQQIVEFSNLSKFVLFTLPPTQDPKDKIWLTAGNQIWDVMTSTSTDPQTAIGDIQALEQLVAANGQSQASFAVALDKFRERTIGRAQALGQYRAIASEVAYFKRDYFTNAMVLCILAFVLVLVAWTTPASRGGIWLTRVAMGLAAAGAAVITAGIVHRCLIMNRPPVGNLYDTIPFIAACAMLVLLLLELLTKRRFAVGVAAFLGTAGLFLAARFEISSGTDTMDPLVAVLDSNFWLSTHVVTIAFGYAGGLVAAFLAHVYVFMRLLNLGGSADRDLRRALTRAVYGCVCLTLFLSLVGTVLGGIWANYSWGRFWGWDPKENGALMIVLVNLIILHARLGGFLKEWGIHLAAVFGAIVVTFSWWHVNFLGVGLHNYGFTDGKSIVWMFYGFEVLILLAGGIGWAIDRNASSARGPQAEQGAQA
jgi:ABC-type transport system involved in cytochrome c biogenesis permease subunit